MRQVRRGVFAWAFLLRNPTPTAPFACANNYGLYYKSDLTASTPVTDAGTQKSDTEMRSENRTGLTQSAIMQVAFGRVRRRVAPLRTMHLLRKQRLSKGHRLVVRRFIASVCKSYRA